jgi:DNA polymerase III subunit epsilon
MAILLGIDLETTGIEPHLGHIIEVGVALYDTETKMLFNEMSLLVNDMTPNAEGNGWVIPDEIRYLTGIHPQTLLDQAVSLANAFNFVHKLASRADYLVAHNAKFETQWILHHLPESPLLTKPLIDTLTDLPYSPHQKHKDLERFCLKHRVFYPHAHRALHDVVAMMDVLKCYPFDKVLERSCSPSIKLQAMVSMQQKDLAKAIGYGWNPENKTVV